LKLRGVLVGRSSCGGHHNNLLSSAIIVVAAPSSDGRREWGGRSIHARGFSPLAPVSPLRGRAGANPSCRRRPPGVACVLPMVAARPTPRAWSGDAVHGGPRRCDSPGAGPGVARVVLVAVERPLCDGAAVVV
jgi:hypothetical protein